MWFRTWKSPKGRQGRVRYWRGRLGVKSTVEEVKKRGEGRRKRGRTDRVGRKEGGALKCILGEGVRF